MPLSGKQRKFVNSYLGECNFSGVGAARAAGYRGNEGTLASVAYENLRKPDIAEAIHIRLTESAMSADEVLMRLGGIARDSDHAGQLKSLELLAKHHKLLEQPKQLRNLNIDVSRLTDDQLRQIAAGDDPLVVIASSDKP